MKPKKILVPIDFSKHSVEALETAVELQKLASSQIIVLHVVEPQVVTFGEMLPGELLDEEVRLKLIEEEMQTLVQKVAPTRGLQTAIQPGTPWEVICETAGSQNADLVVISSHGIKGLQRLVLGSTAERVVRHAPCSVLVIKTQSERRES